MAMKVFNVQDTLGSADVNEYCVNTILAFKTGATTRTSQATQQNDPDLQVTVAPSKKYLLDAMILVGSPAAAGFAYKFFVPASALFVGCYITSQVAGSVTGGGYSTAGLSITNVVQITTAGGATDDFVSIRGLLQTLGSGGTVTFSWAQGTSNAGNTIVRDKSWMLLKRID